MSLPPNPSPHPTRYSGLRPLPHASELNRSEPQIAEMHQQAIAKLIRIAFLVVMLLAFTGSVCAFLVLAYMKTPQARARQNPDRSLVGTWIGENGSTLNIRSDGTGRSRSSTGDRELGYFEWTLDAGEFAIYQYKKKYSRGWFIRRALMDDTPTDRFDVVEVTPTGFTIRTDTARVFTFSSARDDELESAP